MSVIALLLVGKRRWKPVNIRVFPNPVLATSKMSIPWYNSDNAHFWPSRSWIPVFSCSSCRPSFNGRLSRYSVSLGVVLSSASGGSAGRRLPGSKNVKRQYMQFDVADSIARVKSRRFALVVMVIYIVVFASGHVLTNLESGWEAKDSPIVRLHFQRVEEDGARGVRIY